MKHVATMYGVCLDEVKKFIRDIENREKRYATSEDAAQVARIPTTWT